MIKPCRVIIHYSARIVVMWALLFYVSEPVLSEPLWLFAQQKNGWSAGDPVSEELLRGAVKSGCVIRTVSRYFNAVSVEYDGDLEALHHIPGIREIRPVKSFRRAASSATAQTSTEKYSAAKANEDHLLSYGESYAQLQALNIPALHDLGYTGSGVTIGVLDSGFDPEYNPYLQNITIAGKHNFITGAEDVSTGDHHGTMVLVLLGGSYRTEYRGPAFGATYLIAVTEDVTIEARIEEDYWLAGMEWCDSLGVDIISSSLVYNFDHTDPAEDYSVSDMDGETSIIAQAAETAYSRGIIVVNSAGNEGNNEWRIVGTPGDAEHVITVGSVSIQDEANPIIAASSSRGPTADDRIKPDVVAPGANVYIASYGRASGTSYAAPLISGLCALLLEAHPDWTPSDVMAALKYSSRDLGAPGPDNDYGWGLPDAVEANNYIIGNIAEQHLPQNLEFELMQPYPNPFNPVVSIPFTVYRQSGISVVLYDVTGRKVAELWDNLTMPGTHRLVWNASSCASGMYFVQVSTSETKMVRRIVLVK